jgi:hypothetical protein
MARLSRLADLLALAFFVVLLAVPRSAAAQARGPSVHVLAIDSDDSDEQAEALTTALRSQVRSTPGWTLLDTTQSLSMLTAAFQCPQRPDAACLERISEKLKTEQFVWGVMSKAPNHQVSVELHLWAKGKPDKVTRQTFSDNLKDANDDSLKRIAFSLFSQLLGGTGTVAIHVSADAGNVLVDGAPKAALDHGRATLTLPAGMHAIEIQAPGFLAAKRDVPVESGGKAQIEIVLEVDPNAQAAAAPGKPLPIRTIVGWSGVGAGAILIAVGIGFGVSYLSDQSDLNTQRGQNYGFIKGPEVTNPCNGYGASGQQNPNTTAGCNDVSSAHTAVVGEIVGIALGAALAGTGIYLLVTNHPAEASDGAKPTAATSWLKNVRVAPSVSPGGGSMVVLGSF